MWVVFAVLSLLFFVIYDQASRVLAIDSENPRAFAILYNTFAGIFSLFILLIEPFHFKTISVEIIILTLLMIILYGLFNRYEYYAHKYIEVSVLTLIAKIAPIITFFLSVILLGEKLTLSKIVAALFIFGGVILATYKKDKFHLTKGIGYGFLIAILLGFAWTIDKRASSYYPLPIWAFLGFMVPNIFVIPFPTLTLKDIRIEWNRLTWRVVVLALFAAFGYYFLIKAFSVGDASNVILITSCGTIANVLLGIILLRECTDIKRKILATVFVIAGQFFLYFL
jgi:drug/metabolite transporter (DMT)-like permease